MPLSLQDLQAEHLHALAVIEAQEVAHADLAARCAELQRTNGQLQASLQELQVSNEVVLMQITYLTCISWCERARCPSAPLVCDHAEPCWLHGAFLHSGNLHFD